MIRCALIGIGGYGWQLAQAIGRASARHGCRLVAAADARLTDFPERAEALRRDGAELFDDARKMLAALRGRCEAAYVATGIASHAPLTVAAAEAGFHVHLEKPPAATVQEVDAMIAAIEKARRLCLVGFQALHSDDIRFLKDRVVSGRLGAVRSLTCAAGWPRSRSYYARNEWAGRLRCADGWVLDGPATNALAHQVANLLLLASPGAGRLAEPAAVRAELYAAGGFDSHNVAAMQVRTAGGATATFLCAHCTEGHFGPTIRLAGDRGRAEWTMGAGARIEYDDGTAEACPFDPAQQDKMVANFCEAVRAGDGSRLRCDLRAARNVTLALNGAHESSGRAFPIGPEHARAVRDAEGQEHVVVAGLDEALRAAAERSCLLSDLPAPPPWARRTEPYELAGYRSFPQRFTWG